MKMKSSKGKALRIYEKGKEDKRRKSEKRSGGEKGRQEGGEKRQGNSR